MSSNFDFDSLQSAIVAASERALAEVSKHCENNPVRAFALYTDDGAMTVCPAMATADFFGRIVHEEPDDAAYYRFSPAEWPLESVGAEAEFAAISRSLVAHLELLPDGDFLAFKVNLLDTLVRSAQILRHGYLAEWGDDFLLVVHISDSDEPATNCIARMRKLNTPSIAGSFERWANEWY